MIDFYKYTETEKNKLVNSMVIVIDTRERRNEHIVAVFDKHHIPYITKKLDYGDYSFYLPKNEELCIFRDLWFDKEIMVERKGSLEELSMNLAQDRSRFEEELAMSPKNKVLLVEGSGYGDILAHNYNTQFNNKSFLNTLHTFWHRYDMPVFFVSKKESAQFIKSYLSNYLSEYLKRNQK